VESGPVGSASLQSAVFLNRIVVRNYEEFKPFENRVVYDTQGNIYGRAVKFWFDAEDRFSYVEVQRESDGVIVSHPADDFVFSNGRIIYVGGSLEATLERARALLIAVGTNLNLKPKDIVIAQESADRILLVLKTGLYIEVPKKSPRDWKAYVHHNGDVTAWQGSEW